MNTLTTVFGVVAIFAFIYPFMMSYVWMAGALLYYFRFEHGKPGHDEPPVLPEYPLVSILVPCYNEGLHVGATFNALTDLHYPNYEVIAINDGSRDETGEELDRLADEMPKLRVVHMAQNQGKARALSTGCLAARGDYFVCIDCDAILDHYALDWVMSHFLSNPRTGAVTGNPRIRNRATMLGNIQVGEFSAIIGLLKRAQRIYGRVFTVSGVICGFRRVALHRIGYWNSDTLTEDIDVSWRLQLNHWDVRFEPRLLCWILMPETIRGLYKQRLRWAIGGGQALKKYFGMMCRWKSRRMWGVLAEYSLSILWSYTVLGLLLVWLIGFYYDLIVGNPLTGGADLVPSWQRAVLGATCLLQFGISLYIDHRYDHGLLKSFLCTIWYPLFYWILNWITAVMAFPKAMLTKRSADGGRWVTTDRGVSVAPSAPVPPIIVSPVPRAQGRRSRRMTATPPSVDGPPTPNGS